MHFLRCYNKLEKSKLRVNTLYNFPKCIIFMDKTRAKTETKKSWRSTNDKSNQLSMGNMIYLGKFPVL